MEKVRPETDKLGSLESLISGVSNSVFMDLTQMLLHWAGPYIP